MDERTRELKEKNDRLEENLIRAEHEMATKDLMVTTDYEAGNSITINAQEQKQVLVNLLVSGGRGVAGADDRARYRERIPRRQ